MTPSGVLLQGSYDYRLVALSIVIAMAASYPAFDLAARVTAARAGARLCWLIGGATALGIGTWSMHYTGMLAFQLPIPTQYDWPTALLSLCSSVFSYAVALFVVSRREMGWHRTLAGGIFMGGGIVALHYIAMASMRVAATCHYSPALVVLSVAIAMAGSLATLRLTFLFRNDPAGRGLRKASSAVFMGATIVSMHYTAMAAATFTSGASATDLSHVVSTSSLGIAAMSVVPLMVLGIALLTSMVDRLQKQTALLDELFEQAPEAVALLNANNRVVRVNLEFSRVFGYAPPEVIGRPPEEVIPVGEAGQRTRSAELMESGPRVEVESIRQRKDGSRVYVSMVRVPVSLPGGQIAMYEMYRDITESKRVEQDLQRSFDQLRALAARLQSAREEERQRVARELHDELGQALTAIKLDLSSLIRGLSAERAPHATRAESILALADQMIQLVRRISTELRPDLLDRLGLVAALEWAGEEFQARTGIECRLELPADTLVVDPERATAIFRIFQETLTNVARHASATKVDVRLARAGGSLTLEVHDNGVGIGEEPASAGRSLGILGMRERALLLGGEFSINGAPGRGTTVRVRIPLAIVHDEGEGR
jgi:PAS domain S-box-containing protein